jgi:hypothetical protein
MTLGDIRGVKVFGFFEARNFSVIFDTSITKKALPKNLATLLEYNKNCNQYLNMPPLVIKSVPPEYTTFLARAVIPLINTK